MADRAPDWTIEIYLAQDGTEPALEFLDSCPVGDRLRAIVEAVRGYPPPKFPSSQMWHVMKKEMKGIHEGRARHRNALHRLFCLLDADNGGHLGGPALVLLGGGTKPIGTEMDDDVYWEVIAARERYLSTVPRPVA